MRNTYLESEYDLPPASHWKRVAFGISVCPFDWRWGKVVHGNPPTGSMFCVGPIRFAWRW